MWRINRVEKSYGLGRQNAARPGEPIEIAAIGSGRGLAARKAFVSSLDHNFDRGTRRLGPNGRHGDCPVVGWISLAASGSEACALGAAGMGLGQLLVAARMLALLLNRLGGQLPFDLGRRAHH